MDLITLKKAVKLAKDFTISYVNNKIDALKGGMRYIGSVATASDLPIATDENRGHTYTTLDNGHEHVSDGEQWVDLSADLSEIKQALTNLENRVNTLETRPLCPSRGRSSDE